MQTAAELSNKVNHGSAAEHAEWLVANAGNFPAIYMDWIHSNKEQYTAVEIEQAAIDAVLFAGEISGVNISSSQMDVVKAYILAGANVPRLDCQAIRAKAEKKS